MAISFLFAKGGLLMSVFTNIGNQCVYGRAVTRRSKSRAVTAVMVDKCICAAHNFFTLEMAIYQIAHPNQRAALTDVRNQRINDIKES